MVKNKEESKECKEKKLNDKKNKGGYKEPKDPLTEKAPRHQAAALESKDLISDEVAISPAGKDKTEKEEETLSQEAAEVKDKEQFEESVILRYKDSEKFLETVFAYEKMTGTTIPLDFDSDSFIVSVKSEVDKFRDFMKEKGLEEIPYINETDKKIAEVQSKRSGRAVKIDKSIKANRVGHKENPADLKEWAENPARLDLAGID
jgi:hypothetical protein